MEVLVWGLWGPQGCSGSLKMLRFGLPRDGPDLESLRMLRVGVPRDTRIWGPQGCSNSGQGAEEMPLSPPSRMWPLNLQCWVWSKAEMPARTGCAGAHFLGCRGLGSAHGGSSCPAQPQGGGQAAQPPQHLGGAEIHVLSGHNASAFPFHPLPVPVPFQPETWISLLFWVGFLAAFFYYFNLGTVIIFSII